MTTLPQCFTWVCRVRPAAPATVRALTGEINPSGHLAETWPMHYEDCPSSGWYPAIGRDAIYREGPFVGYRYYETAGVPCASRSVTA